MVSALSGFDRITVVGGNSSGSGAFIGETATITRNSLDASPL